MKKTLSIKQSALALVIAGLTILAAASTQAQSNSTSTATAPQLSAPAAEVLKLAQANVGDDTILAYIANSKAAYNLDADQIIYLKGQGVPTAALNAMLSQPKTTSTPAAQPAAAAVVSTTTTTQPTTTVIQAAPATTYYYYQPYYYPAYYGWGYPAVSFSWGWGGSWHGGWHGGGGGWHGGGHH